MGYRAGLLADRTPDPVAPRQRDVTGRRPAAIALLALVPLLLLWAFGMVRVAAPVGLLGLVFDEPWDFALAATLFAVLSLVLMAIPAVDRSVGRWITPTRKPTETERARLEPLLSRAAQRAGMEPARFHLLIEDDEGFNAAAGGEGLLYVTRGALRQLLVVLVRAAAHAAPRTRLERLLDEHPPALDRAQRLAGWS
jgi:hypothetical protein